MRWVHLRKRSTRDEIRNGIPAGSIKTKLNLMGHTTKFRRVIYPMQKYNLAGILKGVMVKIKFQWVHNSK